MHQQLISRLHDYLAENNPDVLIALQQQGKANGWMEEKVQGVALMIAQLRSEGKPGYIIEELCMQEITAELRPSKFNYVSAILEEEFEQAYYSLKECGILVYEIINILSACDPVFEQIPLTEENTEDKLLRYAVTGTIKDYLDKKL
jgi:hypothetical protein